VGNLDHVYHFALMPAHIEDLKEGQDLPEHKGLILIKEMSSKTEELHADKRVSVQSMYNVLIILSQQTLVTVLEIQLWLGIEPRTYESSFFLGFHHVFRAIFVPLVSSSMLFT